MMKIAKAIAVGMAVLFISACVSNEEYIAKLRAAVDQAEVTLVDSVSVAEAELPNGAGLRAALLVNGDPVYSVGTVADSALNDVRVDLTGDVLSVTLKGSSNGPCPDAISLVDALTIAQNAAGGVAVAAVPDDDVACAREIQVLSGDMLWEVKVAGDGRVLEKEESDEGMPEDDD